jgi:hypothetical protein
MKRETRKSLPTYDSNSSRKFETTTKFHKYHSKAFTRGIPPQEYSNKINDLYSHEMNEKLWKEGGDLP